MSKIIFYFKTTYFELFILGRPDDIAWIETTRPSVLLVLPLSFLKNLTTEDAVVSSISQFIAG